MTDRLAEILDGIDRTEVEYDHGWWETSVGAEFGARKKAELQAEFAVLSARLAKAKEALRQIANPASEWSVSEEMQIARAALAAITETDE